MVAVEPSRRIPIIKPSGAEIGELHYARISGLAFATAIIALPVATDAAPGLVNDGVYHANTMPLADPVQLYVYGGHHWCWYDDAWNGPGWPDTK